MNDQTNSKKMTLEERIVQTLKDDSLMKLVGDEDAITELVTRAIREALFQPQRLYQPYGRHDEKDSPVVEAARQVAKTFSEHVAQQVVDELLAKPELREAIRKAVINLLPQAIGGYLGDKVNGLMQSSAAQAVVDLKALMEKQS